MRVSQPRHIPRSQDLRYLGKRYGGKPPNSDCRDAIRVSREEPVVVLLVSLAVAIDARTSVLHVACLDHASPYILLYNACTPS